MELTNSLTNKLTDIADSIREKTGKTSKLQLDEMPGEISSIVTEALLQDKTVTPSKNLQIVKADNEFDGLDEVTVNAIPSEYIVPSGTKEITENGSYDVTNYESANVNIEIGTDTTDATAIAGDIVINKTAYVNGEKVTGAMAQLGFDGLVEASEDAVVVDENSDGTKMLSMAGYTTNTMNSYVKPNSAVMVGLRDNRSEMSVFGNASPTDVVAGKTFSSSSGFLVTGTHECPKGLDTSDATATASDIMSGKTAYVNGSKVTGSIEEIGEEEYVSLIYQKDMTMPEMGFENNYFYMTGNPLQDMILRESSNVKVSASSHFFGSATAADVVAGKTFTSKNGISITGTHECPKGLDTSDANATAGDILSGKTAYVNGSKVTGNISKKSAQTYTPTTANQTIASGQYLDGVQTIQGDSNLVASNIKQGVSIFGVNGNLVSYTIKTGTTTSRTIDTGLSSIEQFFIYKESVTATGLIHLSYSPSRTSYMYASAWTTSSWGSKTITNGTTAATVSGGSITLPSNTATSGGLTSNVTYKWVAIGKA